MNEHIEQAIYELRGNAARYGRTEAYYRGEHQLAFASEKFKNTFGSLFKEFAMNLCPAVCDSVRDKLIVKGFGVEDAGLEERTTPSAQSGGHPSLVRRGVFGDAETFTDQPPRPRGASGTPPGQEGSFAASPAAIARDARGIWRANRMGVRAAEVHKEVLKNGDAYIFVWPDMNGFPTIYPNRAASCTVVYDEESPGMVLWAAKCWTQRDKRVRLNLVYPDRIEKYVSVREAAGGFPQAKDFIKCGTRNAECGIGRSSREDSEFRGRHSEIRNPLGVVPVFHFANNADIGSFGQSELEAAIPIQDGLNKSVLDMLVSMEFAAYRQRWAAGIEIELDASGKPVAPFTAGVEHVWISQNPDARFGDFENSNLEQFLKVKDSFRIDIASVTGTPLHYLMPFTAGFHSGEAFRKAETRFVAKVRSRQEAFGEVWASAMAFALRIAGHTDGIRLITNWEDPDQPSESELLANIRAKRQIGIPIDEALVEAGYGKDEAENWADGDSARADDSKRKL